MSEEVQPKEEQTEKPRIGVCMCCCERNISHVVKCEQVARRIAKQPDVVVSGAEGR